jgi:hypothetical protein
VRYGAVFIRRLNSGGRLYGPAIDC